MVWIRAIGYWVTDVIGSHYNIKLALPAMREMLSNHSRRGKFIRPRSSFYGNISLAHLSGLLFPWVDNALRKK